MIVAVIIALVVVGGAGVWVVTRPSSSTAATPTLVSVTTSTIRQSVSATGTLAPAHRADLTNVPLASVAKTHVGQQANVTPQGATSVAAGSVTSISLLPTSSTSSTGTGTSQSGASSSSPTYAGMGGAGLDGGTMTGGNGFPRRG